MIPDATRVDVSDGVLRLRVPDGQWLQTGYDGGYVRANAAYNVSVPTGFDRTDIEAYATDRRKRSGFDAPGPALLTGVDIENARGAREASVVAVATAGLSNPAALPVRGTETERSGDASAVPEVHDDRSAGTVNVLVWTDRALSDGALATLLGVVVEAKTATLLAETGFTGTTTDAAVVGCRPDGDPAEFAGSATEVGAATRACVREAVSASLDARYDDTDPPPSVAEAEHGVATTRSATVFEPG